jgi:hypothetical protein
VSSVGQGEPARVTEHVGVDRRHPGPDSRRRDQVVHRLPCQRLPALRQEQPGQCVPAGGQIAPKSAQLVASDLLFHRQAVLQPPDPEAGTVEIDFIPAQSNRLADPQPVAVHREQDEVVTGSVPPGLGAIQQGGDLGFAQEIPAPLVRVRHRSRLTFYIWPLGRLGVRHVNSAEFLGQGNSTFNTRRVP